MDKILFNCKVKDLRSQIAYAINSHPNWTIEEYMEEINEKDMDL